MDTDQEFRQLDHALGLDGPGRTRYVGDRLDAILDLKKRLGVLEAGIQDLHACLLADEQQIQAELPAHGEAIVLTPKDGPPVVFFTHK